MREPARAVPHDPALRVLYSYVVSVVDPTDDVFASGAALFETACRFMYAEPEGMAAWLQALAAESAMPLGSATERQAAREFLRNYALYQQEATP